MKNNLLTKISKDLKFPTGKFNQRSPILIVTILAALLSIVATFYSFRHDIILAYGDSESHINIAKRVIDNLTPGLAQLGGIWLPLPHIMMIPFVKIDFLWRTGLAGSIVSGFCFILGSVYIYKLASLLTGNKSAGLLAFLVFALNPNVLYLQTTPLTEMPLISFTIVSGYYFLNFLKYETIPSLILAALFGFCATLSRYDGWFLVIVEAALIFLKYFRYKKNWQKLKGLILLFSTPAFIGIISWIAWDWLILGDPFYFTNSPYSAKSQQQDWLGRGQLPAYHNLSQSFLYYITDSFLNIGFLHFFLFIIGLVVFIFYSRKSLMSLSVIILLSPLFFNIITLYLGQSIIFLPQLTPASFEWNLFNARYGALMIPAAAIFIGFLYCKINYIGKLLIIGIVIIQTLSFGLKVEPVISLEDGVKGLSSAKRPDAEKWLVRNYDNGLVLLDDFSRATSIIRSGIPMENTIYVGNKPYWEESLKEPEKYAKWIIVQKDDTISRRIFSNQELEGRVYKYFNRTYTSPDIQIFKRIE